MPPRLARKPVNTYHHGDLRDALVQAALAEAELGGPESISLKALAKQLGVSQPAPYRHFADREALLEAVTAEAFRQFNAVLRESVSKPSKHSRLSRIARATLEELGYTVAAEAGEINEAMRLAQSAHFDLAILDVNVNGKVISPVAELIKARNRPFIFATGYGSSGLPEEYRDRPALQKPFQLETLAKMIDAAMKSATV